MILLKCIIADWGFTAQVPKLIMGTTNSNNDY